MRLRTGIFGAGQAGLMVMKWLPADFEVVCFLDNDIKKHGTILNHMPVLPVEEALKLDQIVIAILNREAVEEIREKLIAKNFTGKIFDINDFRGLQDIRLAELRLMAVQIKERNVPGSVAELGVYKGAFAAELNRVFPERKIFLFDTFSGFDSRDRGNAVPKMDFSDTSIELVKGILPYPSQAVFIAGRFPDSLTLYQNLPDNYAIISLDADLYNPTLAGLEYFWPRLSTGGAILIPDPDHSEQEERCILLGLSAKLNMLVVCHCYRASETVIRLISARKATRKETQQYNGFEGW